MNAIAGKSIIITGAASGMGRSMAELFAREGAKLIIADYNAEGLKAIEKEIADMGAEVFGVSGDVSKEEDIKNIVNTCLERFGKIDVLINNAGIMDDFYPAGEVSNELWNKVLAINLTGPFFACRAVLPIMENQGKGVIINVSSVGGLHGSRAGAAYTSAKHGLIGLTKNIGFMYAMKGIRCNAIAPGGVATNIMAKATPNPSGLERCTSGAANNPRMGDPMEIAQVALFLSTDDSSFINGEVITADGGWTAY